MLTELDKKLIKKENEKFDAILVTFKKEKSDIKKILNKYNLYEFTEHWYDGSPIQCNTCKHTQCSKCAFWKKWNKSEEQLSFNNWIDVIGPDIWDMTQKDCNKIIKNLFKKEIFKDVEFKDRLFKAFKEDNKEYLELFYYNRDRSGYDYWFIFKEK